MADERLGHAGVVMSRRLPSVVSLLSALATIATLLTVIVDPAAAERRALVLGVSEYKTGIPKLAAPRTDADEITKVLKEGRVSYRVEQLQEANIKDKAAFMAALNRFVESLRSDDEVVFYFSGHGLMVDGVNYYLLGNAKSEENYLKDLGPAVTRDLDTNEKRAQRYQQWIAEVAISEKEVEDTILAKRPNVLIIIADACRSIIQGGKGLAPVPSKIGVNREAPNGVFRIYAASPGEVAYDAPDRIYVQGKGSERRETSLFTSVLVNEIRIPNVEINQLFGTVKFKVREQAQKQGQRQVPHFTEGRDVSSYYFWPTSRQEIAERCSTAFSEIEHLRFGVQSGGISRETLERKAGELAPCGLSAQIDQLLRLESQGIGALSTTVTQNDPRANITDPVQKCDYLASSPFDPNRAQNLAGPDIQQAVLRSLDSAAERTRVQTAIDDAIKSCETAVSERPRIARYKFNLARAHYARASMHGLGREEALRDASRWGAEAVDMGYTAAFNDVALLLLNGEFRGQSSTQKDRRRMAVALLQRGADLGHVLALYNLGMAYKNGDLSLELAALDNSNKIESNVSTLEARAFRNLSRAAEGGFVPAMIEKALLQRDGRGVEVTTLKELQNHRTAAIELMLTAASRGSWEAMYRLGETYEELMGAGHETEALVWYARAAEAGDSRAQKRLAKLLFDGDGVPAPQREAAGRYWRLAADSGDIDAQMRIADLLRDGKIPFRPRTDGKSDGGALEIARLYSWAFARGNPGAGLRLARLFRTGFPVGSPSDVIPKDQGKAVDLLWATIRQVRASDPASIYADPSIEAAASFELIKIFDEGHKNRRDGSDLFSDDQIEDLKARFGSPSEIMWVRVAAIGPIKCPALDPSDNVKEVVEYWALIWNGSGARNPTEDQFDWLERRHRCKRKLPDSKIKDEDLGFTKKTRDIFKREWDAALKEKEKDAAKKRAFVDRIVELVSADKPKKK